MSDSPLSRLAAPIAIVGGALVVVKRPVSLTVPAELKRLKTHVLTATHAINSVASIIDRGLRA
ncbi:MAG: hypothetical protein WBM90_12015, partial [Acidimicrobiia bacterium]